MSFNYNESFALEYLNFWSQFSFFNCTKKKIDPFHRSNWRQSSRLFIVQLFFCNIRYRILIQILDTETSILYVCTKYNTTVLHYCLYNTTVLHYYSCTTLLYNVIHKELVNNIKWIHFLQKYKVSTVNCSSLTNSLLYS